MTQKLVDKSAITTKSWVDEANSPWLVRATIILIAIVFHLGALNLLLSHQSQFLKPQPRVFTAILLREPARPPPLPEESVVPVLMPPVALPDMMPDIRVAEAPAHVAEQKAAASSKPSRSSFAGQASAGLDMDVATSSSGGAGVRAALGDFAAGVKARILARKVQPVLAKELRNTCLINYTVSIDKAGHMLSYTIAPCTVAAINEAARAAVAGAGPFPPPPDLGATHTEVHGSLVFEP